MSTAAGGDGRAASTARSPLPASDGDEDEAGAEVRSRGQQVREAAHRYLEDGLLPVPAWAARQDGGCCCPRGAGCGRPGKHPRSVRSGPGPRDYSWKPLTCRTHAEIDQRFADDGPYAAGNLMVAIPEQMMAVDVDDDDGGRAAAAGLAGELGDLPPTVSHRTPHGEHLIYRTPPGWKGRAWVGKDPANPLPPGIDLRMPGQILMAAPSLVPGPDAAGPVRPAHRGPRGRPARLLRDSVDPAATPAPARRAPGAGPARQRRPGRPVRARGDDPHRRRPGQSPARRPERRRLRCRAESRVAARRGPRHARRRARPPGPMSKPRKRSWTPPSATATPARTARPKPAARSAPGSATGCAVPGPCPTSPPTRPQASASHPGAPPPLPPPVRGPGGPLPGVKAGRWQDMVPDDIRRQVEDADRGASDRRRAAITAHQRALEQHSQATTAATAAEVQRTRAAAHAAHEAYTRDGRHVTGRHDAAMLRWAADIAAQRDQRSQRARRPASAAEDTARVQANRAAVAANEAYKAGDLDRAEQLTEQAAALDPSRAGLWQQHRNDIAARRLILSARAAHADGDHERAKHLLQDARQLDPRLRTLWDGSLPTQRAAQPARPTPGHNTITPEAGDADSIGRQAATAQSGERAPQLAWPSAPVRPGSPGAFPGRGTARRGTASSRAFRRGS